MNVRAQIALLKDEADTSMLIAGPSNPGGQIEAQITNIWAAIDLLARVVDERS